MGNNAAKPPAEAPSSPVVNHTTSRSSTLNSRASSSRHKASQQYATHSEKQHHATTQHRPTTSPPSSQSQPFSGPPGATMGNEQSKAKATPVKVPVRGADHHRQRGPDTQFEPSGPPGSPIIDAHGSSALHEDEVGGLLPRQTSTVSNTTLEDDELGNELRQYPTEAGRGTVPTTVYWKQGGQKVYVTGTFTNWCRKFRLNKE